MNLFFFGLFMFDAIKVSVTSIEWQILCCTSYLQSPILQQNKNKKIEKFIRIAKTSFAIASIVKAI